MRKLHRRIRDNRGETLIESMAAILIFTFASILMLTMFSAAVDINHTADQWEETHLAQMEHVERAEEEAGTEGTVRFSINGVTETVPVDVFGTGSGPYAYYPVWEGVPE